MKRHIPLIVAALMLIAVIPFHIFAEETFVVDTTLMAEGSNGAYTGDKDAAFEIDGDTIRLHFNFYTGENPLRVTTEYGGCNATAAAWFNAGNFRNRGTIALNGVELTKGDTTQSSYFTIARTQAATPTDPVIMDIVIKPGVEITADFFSKNQLVLNQVNNNGEIVDTVTIGTIQEPEEEYTFSIDRTLMAEGSNGAYTGDKDAAFEIDGDTIRLHFNFYTGENPLRVTTEYGGCNATAAAWFNAGNFRNRGTIALNGVELTKGDTTQSSYFTIARTQAATPTDPVIMDIVIKPGVEITADFFSKNQLVLNQVTSSGDIADTVKVGKSTSPTPDTDPEPTIKPAKTITAAEDYRVPSEANQINNLQLKISNDNDTDWASKLTQVTYSYGDSTPAAMVLGSGNITVPYSGDPFMSVNSGEIAAQSDGKSTILIGVRYSFFQNQNIPKGETREYTFTFKADGYEDSVVKQTVRNPKEVLEVAVNKGAKYSFALEDLQKMWQDEGSKEYTYSSYNTFPSFETEKFYGPTVEAVLAASNIDIATLADNDVIEFTANDGYKAKITVKDFKEKRYYFPNGKSPDDARFKGTTAAQLEGKVEVPYIVSLKGGEDDLRNIFGQRDPQEVMKNDWNQSLAKITIYKDAATEFDGVTPTIVNESKVKEGDKLFFDIDYSNWQGGSRKFAGVYYTVSTDGTEPADPTLSDVLYNFADYQLPDYTNPEDWGLLNYYEFTDAETTIIKFMAYARGYSEPVVQTLRYENAGAEELACELTSSEGNDLKVKKHTTLTAEVTNGAVEDYTYKFIVYNKTTNQWYKLRDFEASNTFDWYTGPAGEKTLFVDVKDVEGNVERFQLDVDVTESDLAVKSFTISPEGVLPTKSQATLTAEAEKGVAPYEYKFIVYNETTQQWYKLKDFGSESTFDWYTGPEGSKKLYVDVKDADGTVVRQVRAVTVTEAGAVQLDNAA